MGFTSTRDLKDCSEMPKPEESPETKHKVVFLSEEEAKVSSTVQLGEAEDGPPGLILPNGEINWNCPCLGGMAVGPCGVEFREAFSCFHYSEAEPKGSDCIEKFAEMQKCMQGYPELLRRRKGQVKSLKKLSRWVKQKNLQILIQIQVKQTHLKQKLLKRLVFPSENLFLSCSRQGFWMRHF